MKYSEIKRKLSKRWLFSPKGRKTPRIVEKPYDWECFPCFTPQQRRSKNRNGKINRKTIGD